MRYSNTEMVLLNSVAKGNPPFGLSFSIPAEEASEKDFLSNAVSLLKDRELVDQRGKLSGLGLASIRLFEIYKNAREHIAINRMRICKTEKGELIVLSPINQGYDLCCVSPELIMYVLLKQFSFLRMGQEREAQPFAAEKIKIDAWAPGMGDYGVNYIFAGRYRDHKPCSEKMYYWDEEGGYEYDFAAQEQLRLWPREMRFRFLDLLGVETEGYR